jgi:hypothetical protein
MYRLLTFGIVKLCNPEGSSDYPDTFRRHSLLQKGSHPPPTASIAVRPTNVPAAATLVGVRYRSYAAYLPAVPAQTYLQVVRSVR